MVHARRSLTSRLVLQMRDRFPPGGGRHHFFASRSFSPRCRASLGIEPLQLRVLVLERLQPLRLRNVHPAVLRLPLVERRRRHPVLAADLGDRCAGLLLPQHPDDLLFGEPASLHLRSLSCGPDSSSPWRRNKGSRHRIGRQWFTTVEAIREWQREQLKGEILLMTLSITVGDLANPRARGPRQALYARSISATWSEEGRGQRALPHQPRLCAAHHP